MVGIDISDHNIKVKEYDKHHRNQKAVTCNHLLPVLILFAVYPENAIFL